MDFSTVSKQFPQELDSKLPFAHWLYIVWAYGSVNASGWNYWEIGWRISKSCDLYLTGEALKLTRQGWEDARAWSNMYDIITETDELLSSEIGAG